MSENKGSGYVIPEKVVQTDKFQKLLSGKSIKLEFVYNLPTRIKEQTMRE